MTRTLLTISLLTVTLSPGTAADNWLQFRGPGALGVSDGKGLPHTWSAEQNIEWKRDLPGRGWSSPIVWRDRVFLTTCVSSGKPEEARKGLYFGGNRLKPPTVPHDWKVLCLGLKDGKVEWEKTVHSAIPKKSLHIKNSYASETPVTDGELVYAYFGNVGIFTFQLDGTPGWSKKFPAVSTRFEWGTAASPVLHADRLYVINDNEESSYLLALDKKTGDEIWKVNRQEKSNWATPFVWDNELRTEIITPGTGKTRAYGVDGKLLYEFGGASSITIATPYAQHGLLYVSSGYILDRKKPIWALKPGATGDITLKPDQTSNEFVRWCRKGAAPYNPTTIVYGDQLYSFLDRGFVAGYDALTGEEVYDRQRLPEGRAFTSSPWAADGKLFFLNEFGTTFVIQAGREYRLLHTNSLTEDEMCMATPALAGDRLLIRTDRRLYCLRNDS